MTPAKIDPRVQQIERTRKAQELTQAELCRRARVPEQNWRAIRRGAWAPSLATIERLQAALSEQYIGTPHASIVGAIICSSQAILRMAGGGDLSDGRLRRMAIYLAAVELQIENADLARAGGMSRQNVQQARNKVEDLRERDPSINALLDRCAALVRGEA